MKRAAAILTAALALLLAGCIDTHRIGAMRDGELTADKQDLAAFETALRFCAAESRSSVMQLSCTNRRIEHADLVRAVSSCPPQTTPYPGCRQWWEQVGVPQIDVLMRLVKVDELVAQKPDLWGGAGPLVPWSWADRRVWIEPLVPRIAWGVGLAVLLAGGVSVARDVRARRQQARDTAQAQAQAQAQAAARARPAQAPPHTAGARPEPSTIAAAAQPEPDLDFELDQPEPDQADAEAARAAAAAEAEAEANRQRLEQRRQRTQQRAQKMFGKPPE